jgi:hypothetical protein
LIIKNQRRLIISGYIQRKSGDMAKILIFSSAFLLIKLFFLKEKFGRKVWLRKLGKKAPAVPSSGGAGVGAWR